MEGAEVRLLQHKIPLTNSADNPDSIKKQQRTKQTFPDIFL